MQVGLKVQILWLLMNLSLSVDGYTEMQSAKAKGVAKMYKLVVAATQWRQLSSRGEYWGEGT